VLEQQWPMQTYNQKNAPFIFDDAEAFDGDGFLLLCCSSSESEMMILTLLEVFTSLTKQNNLLFLRFV
jgi:hypothetical protein